MIVAVRGRSAHVSMSPELQARLATELRQADVDELIDPTWWTAMLGPTYEVLGPSIHHQVRCR